MVQNYLDWYLSFIGSGIDWLLHQMVTPSVSLFAFILAVAMLSIVIGGILLR